MSSRGGRNGPRRAHRLRLPLPCLLLCSLTILQCAPAGADASSGEAFLALNVNGRPSGLVVLIRKDAEGRVSMQRQDLQAVRLALPQAPQWQVLDELAGVSYRIENSTQTLWIDAAAAAFDSSTIRLQGSAETVPPVAERGGFLNYDVVVSDADTTRIDGFLEMNWFGPQGVLSSTHVVRDLGGQPEPLRLDTTWSRDDPERGATLRLGDTFSSRAAWSRSLRIAGWQWASNPATQPERPRLPLQSFVGETALPSTLEVYVNDALRLQSDLPPGPFAIEDLPVISGAGLTRVVVTDILGREQVYLQPFYGSSRLLRQGLRDYAFELGLLRRAYGQRSNRYGSAVAVATWREGISDVLTIEAQAQASSRVQALGLGAARALGGAGVAELSIATSTSTAGHGRLLDAAYRYQGRGFSVGGQWQWRSTGFRLLDESQTERRLRLQGQLFASLDRGGAGSYGLSYTLQRYDDGERLAIFGFNHSRSLRGIGFVNLGLLQIDAERSDWLATLSFTRPLGRASSVSATARRRPGDGASSLQWQRNLPTGRGYGYRLRAEPGADGRFSASLAARGDVATANLELARSSGRWSSRLTLEGGWVWFGGSAHLSRRIDSSFALVEVDGFADVAVRLDNQEVGVTDSDGRLLVPGLRPYQRNRLSIEQADLPLTAEIDRLDSEAVPWFRSGIRVEFPVRVSLSALLTVVLENGDPVPAGAVATLIDSGQRFLVGYAGQLYLNGLQDHNRLRIEGAGLRCSLRFDHPGAAVAMPALGPLRCIDEGSAP